MKYKFNPLTGEFNLVPDSGTLKQKLNWLTGNFNLTKDAGKYKQIYNVIEGEFNLYPATTQVVIHGTGSVQLTNAVKNGLLSLTVYGGTEQNGTPTPDAPVDIVCNNGALKFSKNLANITAENIIEQNFINNSGVIQDSPMNFIYSTYIPVKPNTDYTLSGNKNFRYASLMEYDVDKNFIKRTLKDSTTGLSKSWTTASNAAYVLFGSNPGYNETMTLDVVQTYDWQFEEGNTATPYKPYVEGGVYIEGTVETISNGFNLFDINKVTDGYYYTTQGQYEAAAAARLTDFIPVQAGETYVFKYTATSSPNVRLNYFDTNKTWLSQTITSSSSGSFTYNITPAQNGYISISANRVNAGSISYIDWDNMVIEAYGSIATAEMLLKIGNYVDEQEILSGNIIRKIGIKVFDGTETFISGNNGRISENAITDQINADYQPYCTHFVGTALTPTSDNKVRVYITTSSKASRVYFGLDKTIYTSTSVFKQWLTDQYNAGTPVILLYVLETETTETVAGQIISIPKGNSTIEITQASLDDLELEATYEQEA